MPPIHTRTSAALAAASDPSSPSRATVPLYQQLADTLVAEIERGTYKVGDMLPPELVIASMYGVSRFTAREAIRRLTELGLISRRAGLGTTVKATVAQSRYSASISDIEDLIHYTRQTRLKILAEEWVRIEERLAQIIAGAEGQTWLKIRGMRYPRTGNLPISCTNMFVHPSYERVREQIKDGGVAVYRLIEKIYGERIHEVRQDIGCTSLDKTTAALLDAKAGSPALLIYRYYLGKNEALISVSENIYPQDRFTLSTRWRLDLS
jgi:GntR family transcriptional regulator